MTQIENWKPVVGYEGLYEVSDCGRVRSLDHETVSRAGWKRIQKGKVLKLRPDKDGYLTVALCLCGKVKAKKVHRLVLESFVRTFDLKEETRHLDGNPSNNHLNNLVIGTAKENGEDRVLHQTSGRGQSNSKSKLTLNQVIEMRRLFAEGLSMRAIADKFKLNIEYARLVVKGVRYLSYS